MKIPEIRRGLGRPQTKFNPYREGHHGKKGTNNSEHSSKPNRSVGYWPLCPWGQEVAYTSKYAR